MSKLSDSQVLALKALANGSIQDESAAFAGEPTSITVDESEPDKFKLKAKFVNTDQVMASDWIEQTMSDLHFGIDQYVIELEGDDDTEVTASAVFNLSDTVQGSIIKDSSSASATAAHETDPETVPEVGETVSDDTSDGTTDDTTSTEQEPTTEANTTETTEAKETTETTKTAESNEDDIDEEINVDMNHLTHHARLAAFTTVSVSQAEPARTAQTAQATQATSPAENSPTTDAPANNAVITETSTETAEANKAAFKEAKKRKGPSAFARFKEIVDKAIPNMTSETIAQLTDQTFCKEKAHIAYPILIEVDPASDYKSQATFRGKYRYSKKVMSILGKDYYITNHIFERNVAITQDLFTDMKLI